MTMVRVGAGVVVLRRCLEIEGEMGGESSTGRSYCLTRCIGDEATAAIVDLLHNGTRKSAESARLKKYTVEIRCSSLLIQENPLSEPSAVVMIKSRFFFL